jgi:predicted nucleic acid-binding protein
MPTTLVFVDTNILLYAVSTNPVEADKRQVARKLLSENSICFSVQVAQEFFVNAIRKLTPPLSLVDALGFLRAINPTIVVALDYALFEEAARMQERFQISYWDAAIVTAAGQLNCKTLFSEDLADGQNYSGVRVVNPFNTIARPST